MRRELGERAHREVQIARRRRREAEDEAILFRSARAAGFGEASSPSDADRRRAIDEYLTARAEEVMDAVVAQKAIDEVVGFSLELAPSKELPQPIAGDGVFVKDAEGGEVPAGTMLAFYPGSVYMPHEVRWFGGIGALLGRAGQDTSSHVIGRVGGVRIDGLWSGIEVPAAEYQLDDDALDAIVERLEIPNEVGRAAARDDVRQFREELLSSRRPSGSEAEVLAPIHGGTPSHVRRLNPLAVGEMINHPPTDKTANVLGWPVDLNLSRDEYARVAPNSYALRPEGAPAPGAPCPFTVVMVAAKTLKPGDELWLDYGCELLPVEDIPVWFTPASLRKELLEGAGSSAAAEVLAELHAWRESFAAAHGRKATRHDLLADPAASALFHTFQKYRKLGDV